MAQCDFMPGIEAYHDPRDRPSVLVTSPGSPDLLRHGGSGSGASLNNSAPPHNSLTGGNRSYAHRLLPGGPSQQYQQPPAADLNVGGSLQIKLGYDTDNAQLVVTIIGASNLTARPNGSARNPYAKVFMLPDRSDKSKRRTKTLASTNEPRWGQIFRYTGYRRADLCNRLIEVRISA